MQQQSVDSAVEVLSGVDQLLWVETVVEEGGDSVEEGDRWFTLSRVHHPSVPEGGEHAKHGVHGGRVAESERHLVELWHLSNNKKSWPEDPEKHEASVGKYER